MAEAKSDSPNKCGFCGGAARTPDRFTSDDAAQMDGVFNVCDDCGAECSGTGGFSESDRWHWTGAREVGRQRAAMEAAEADADWAECQRWDR